MMIKTLKMISTNPTIEEKFLFDINPFILQESWIEFAQQFEEFKKIEKGKEI